MKVENFMITVFSFIYIGKNKNYSSLWLLSPFPFCQNCLRTPYISSIFILRLAGCMWPTDLLRVARDTQSLIPIYKKKILDTDKGYYLSLLQLFYIFLYEYKSRCYLSFKLFIINFN